jgi:hypothetical protein
MSIPTAPYSPEFTASAVQPPTPSLLAPAMRQAPSIASTQEATQTGNSQSVVTIVEAIANSKELILNEVARLLDDKLSGLDEVVVELIKAKTENEALKAKLIDLTQQQEQLTAELNSFKPVQFGFYKKVK